MRQPCAAAPLGALSQGGTADPSEAQGRAVYLLECSNPFTLFAI